MTSTGGAWRSVVAALLVVTACAALVVHARITLVVLIENGTNAPLPAVVLRGSSRRWEVGTIAIGATRRVRIRPLDAGPLYVEFGEPAMRRGSSVDYTDVWYGSGKGRVELRVRSDSVSVFRQGHETAVQAQARVARAGSSAALPLVPVE